MTAGLADVAPLTAELFLDSDLEQGLSPHVVPRPADLRAEVDAVLATVLSRAGLAWPDGPVQPAQPALHTAPPDRRGEFDAVLATVLSRAGLAWPDGPVQPVPRGVHTAELAGLLDELQSVARVHPGATW